MQRYFEILGISEDASPDEIRKAYLIKVRDVHPDTCRSCSANELLARTAELPEVEEAYRKLLKERETSMDLAGEEETSTNSPGGEGISTNSPEEAGLAGSDGFDLFVGLGIGIVGSTAAICIAKRIKNRLEKLKKKKNRRLN